MLMLNDVPVTVVEFINYSSKYLKDRNIDDPRLNAELMLCEILNCNRVNLYLNFEKPLNSDEKLRLKDYLRRRVNHEPLQYIIGKTSFYGLDFVVNKNVLIPRPETELLVEMVLNDIKKTGKTNNSIFEIGTGSGCISIALGKILEKENIVFDIVAIDVSKASLENALMNLNLIIPDCKHIKFYEKDVFEVTKLNRYFDYIISNPPYISFDEYKLLKPELKEFEPDLALTDFSEGLKFFERILLIASDADFKGKVFFEIGFGQRSKLEELLKLNKISDYNFYKDYNGIDRILEIQK